MPVSTTLPPGRDNALDNAPPTLDATRCPLCGKLNLCAMEVERATGQKQGLCWCTTAQFDAVLLARIPPDKRNLACVCADCAQKRG